MYQTTDFTPALLAELCAVLNDANPEAKQTNGRPPALTREQEIHGTIIYKRRNRTEHELAEMFAASQSTISRAINRWRAIRNYPDDLVLGLVNSNFRPLGWRV